MSSQHGAVAFVCFLFTATLANSTVTVQYTASEFSADTLRPERHQTTDWSLLNNVPNASGCPDDTIRISCRPEEKIAIHRAIFNGNDLVPANVHCNPSERRAAIANKTVTDVDADEIRKFSIQAAVNRRLI